MPRRSIEDVVEFKKAPKPERKAPQDNGYRPIMSWRSDRAEDRLYVSNEVKFPLPPIL